MEPAEVNAKLQEARERAALEKRTESPPPAGCMHGKREGEEAPFRITFHRGTAMHALYCPNCGAIGPAPASSPTLGDWALPRLSR